MSDAEVEPSVRESGAGEVTVAVVDDNPVIRMGVSAILAASDRLTLVGEAGDGDAAIRLARDVRPDVTLLDVRMPKRDGVQVVAEVSACTKVLMLTYSDSPDVVRAAVDAGASGYLVHGHMAPHELERAVLAVAEGSLLLSETATQALRTSWQAPSPRPESVCPETDLSDREREVMDHVSRGLTNGEIARELFLTEKTVKNHINRIFAKLGVRSRAEAVAMWLGQSV